MRFADYRSGWSTLAQALSNPPSLCHRHGCGNIPKAAWRRLAELGVPFSLRERLRLSRFLLFRFRQNRV
jgi:hypothetical protein